MKIISLIMKITLIVCMLITFSGCSALNGESSNDKQYSYCNDLIGKGDTARLDGQYEKSNQYYFQALSSETCNKSKKESIQASLKRSHSSIAYNYMKLGNYKEALNEYNALPPEEGRYYKPIALAHTQPAKANEIITNLQKSDSNINSIEEFLKLRYSNGERTISLLKDYLSIIDSRLNATYLKRYDDLLDYYDSLIHSEAYNIPIKLAEELEQPKIANVLRTQQAQITAIEKRAMEQGIPGPGSSSGNSKLLATRAYFYSQEYKKAGFNELANVYEKSFQKESSHAIEVANQRAINLQDAADKAQEKTEYNNQLLSSLLTSAATVYTNTASNKKNKSISDKSNNNASANPYVANSSFASPKNINQLQQSNPQPMNTNSEKKVYPDAGHCLQRDSTSNSLSDFWINSCSFSVNVMWFDSKYCSSGCTDKVKPNNRQTITKADAGSIFTWVACPEPSTAKGPDGVKIWTNNGRHVCTF